MANQPKRKRRHNGEGTVERNAKGQYRLRVELAGRVRISSRWSDTLHEARESLNDTIAVKTATTNDLSEAKEWLFGEWAFYIIDTQYRNDVKSGTLRKATFNMYRQFWKSHLFNTPICSIPLKELRPVHFSDWLAGLKTKPITKTSAKGETVVVRPSAPLSPASSARILGMVKAILELAVTNRVLEFNPAKSVRKPVAVQTPIRVLTADEVNALLKIAADYDTAAWSAPNGRTHPSARHRAEIVVRLGLHGLGPAEMCGLETSHWDGMTLVIVQQNNAVDGLTRSLKTRNRAGSLPIADKRLCELLDAATGRFILEASTGAPLSVANLRRLFRAMTKKTPFDGMRPYELRHTCAQRMVELGVDPRTAAEVMRHSVAVMLNVYVRSNENLKRDALSKLFPDDPPRKPTLKDLA